MRNNKTRLAGLAVAFFVLLTGLAFTTGGPAQAEVSPETQACYEQVTEYRYERTVQTETFKTQYEVDKFVRDRTREEIPAVKGFWTNFQPNNSNEPFEGPPSYPSDPRGTWSDPKTNGGPQQNASGVFQNGQGNGSWFYRQQGTPKGYTEWSEWSAPYRWEPVGSHLAWVDEIPAENWRKHGQWTETYQRQWTVYPTGNERQVSTGFVPETQTTDWVTEAPEGEGWEQIEERTVNGERIPCPVEKLRLTFIQECGTFTPLDGPWVAPETVTWRIRNSNSEPVDYTISQAGGGFSASGTAPIGDSFFTTPFGARTLILKTLNDLGGVAHQDTKAGGDTYLTTTEPSEQYPDGKCTPTTPDPIVDEGEWVDGSYECGDTTVEQTRTVTTITYEWDGEKFVGASSQVIETQVRDLTAEEIFPCPTVPPTTQPPTTEPPVVTVPPTTTPPVVTTAPTVPPTAPPTTDLPATGSAGTALLILVALGLLVTGSGVALLARRR